MEELTQEYLYGKVMSVVDRLLNLGGGEYQKDKNSDKDSHTKGQVERDFGIEEWDWPQGVGLLGLVKLQNHFQDSRYDNFLSDWFQRNFKTGLPSRNVNTTAPFMTLLDFAERTDHEGYTHECQKQAQWLIENLPKTKENGFQHVVSGIGDRQAVCLNDGQLWVDTIFMAVLFLNAYAQKYQVPAYAQEATHQILLHIKYLYEKECGLFYHGWSFIRNDNFGKVFWCRGNAWFTLGITEFLSQDGTCPLEKGVKRYLIDTYLAQVSALAKLQTQSGLWTTVLNDTSSYEEVSGSAGITAGIYRGLRLGLLDDSYEAVADKAITAICKNIASDGTVGNVSAGTVIGMDSQAYQRILIRPMAYGQALVLIALTEALGRKNKYTKE